MSGRYMAHRVVERRLDVPLVEDERWMGPVQAIACGVILALVFLAGIPALGLVLGAALGIDMTTAP